MFHKLGVASTLGGPAGASLTASPDGSCLGTRLRSLAERGGGARSRRTPEEAEAKGWPGQEGSLGRKVLSWEARGAGSPLGGMKQPRISAGRAKCGSGAQSASSNCLGSQGAARCQVQHWAWGAWPRVSNDAAEAIAGRGRWGSGREGKPHPLGAHCAARAGREPRRQLPLPRTRHLCVASRVPLSVPERGRWAAPAVWVTWGRGGTLFSRKKLFCDTECSTRASNSVQK